jgi:acetyl esterase
LRKAARLRGASRFYHSLKRVKGQERFLETCAGPVRVLCYGFDDERVLPLFVNLHGGGFVMGSPEMDDPFMPRLAERAGVKIISVDYALAPHRSFPAPLDDCLAVLDYAKERAEELRIDPACFAVGGHSAGGCLAAAICVKNAESGELPIKAAILDYPVVDCLTNPLERPRGKGLVSRVFLSPDMAAFFGASYCSDADERSNPLVSPIFASREQLAAFPPTLIITAGKDTLRQEAERFAGLLRRAGARVTCKRFTRADHGFPLFGGPDAAAAWRLMAEHLSGMCGSSETA